jgi:hypothetical protein
MEFVLDILVFCAKGFFIPIAVVLDMFTLGGFLLDRQSFTLENIRSMMAQIDEMYE